MNIILIIIFTCLSMPAYAKHLHTEKYYQNLWCNEHAGVQEVLLPDNTRIDCLTSEYAVEFGFIDHKYEDVGQSLYYSLIANKKPAIATIIENEATYHKHLNILRKLCDNYGIKLIIIRP